MSVLVKDLSFSYDTHEVLHGLSFDIPDGEFVSVLGPNGVGKSTLFKCILGLLKGFQGQIVVDGQSTVGMHPKQLAKTIAYVPQNHYPTFNYSVFDMVLMGTSSLVSGFSSPGKREEELAYQALKRLDLEYLLDRDYAHISGGEQQLVLIARALAQNAHTIIMDEPTANLDYGNQLRVLQRIRSLISEGYTIIQSTHNPDQSQFFSDRILAINDGRIVADGVPSEVITSELIWDLYKVKVEIGVFFDGRFRSCVPRFLLKDPPSD